MAKQTLRDLEVAALAVALDHLEEHGPPAVVPDPAAGPGEYVYLTYIGADQAAALAARLPHVDVLFRTPAGSGKNKVVRKVYDKAAIMHVLRQVFPADQDFTPFVRDLARVNRKYWRVQPAG